MFFPPGPPDSGLLTNQTLRGGASPRKSGWSPVVTAQQGPHGQGGAQPGQALPTCPGPFAVGPTSPFPSPCPLPRMGGSKVPLPRLWSHVHLGHAWEGSWWTSSPLCPGKPLLQSERQAISLRKCHSIWPQFSLLFLFLFLLPHHNTHMRAHTNTPYCTVPAISSSTATFLWNSRDSVSHGPKVLLRHPAVGPRI